MKQPSHAMSHEGGWIAEVVTREQHSCRRKHEPSLAVIATAARKVALSIGPSNTAVAVSSVGRSAATTVCVCQWPHGV